MMSNDEEVIARVAPLITYTAERRAEAHPPHQVVTGAAAVNIGRSALLTPILLGAGAGLPVQYGPVTGGTVTVRPAVAFYHGACDGVTCALKVVTFTLLPDALAQAEPEQLCDRIRAHVVAFFDRFAGTPSLLAPIGVACRPLVGGGGGPTHAELLVATPLLSTHHAVKESTGSLLPGSGRPLLHQAQQQAPTVAPLVAPGQPAPGRLPATGAREGGAHPSPAGSTPMKEQAIAKVLRGVVEVLAALHEGGAWHGGVKASNAFLIPDAENGSLVIAGIGSAGVAAGAQQQAEAAAAMGESPPAAGRRLSFQTDPLAGTQQALLDATASSAPAATAVGAGNGTGKNGSGATVVLTDWWYHALHPVVLRPLGAVCDGLVPVSSDYMCAPEIATNPSWREAWGSVAADSWGLGLLAMDLAEGAPPTRRRAPALLDTAPMLRAHDGWSVALRDFVRQCLVLDPCQRATACGLLKGPTALFYRRCSLSSASNAAGSSPTRSASGCGPNGGAAGSTAVAMSREPSAGSIVAAGPAVAPPPPSAAATAGGNAGALGPLPTAAQAATGSAAPAVALGLGLPFPFVHVVVPSQQEALGDGSSGSRGGADGEPLLSDSVASSEDTAAALLSPNLALGVVLPAVQRLMGEVHGGQGLLPPPPLPATADSDGSDNGTPAPMEEALTRIQHALLALGAVAPETGNAWTLNLLAQIALHGPSTAEKVAAAALCARVGRPAAVSVSGAGSPTRGDGHFSPGRGPAAQGGAGGGDQPQALPPLSVPPPRYTAAEMSSYAFAKWSATAAATLKRLPS